MGTPLILVGNRIIQLEQYRRNSAQGIIPRLDYIEIASQMGAEVRGQGLFRSLWYNLLVDLQRSLRVNFIEALYLAPQFARHNGILSFSEKTGIPVSAILAATHHHFPHIVIGHHLSSAKKTLLFRTWPLHKTFSHVICVSKCQADYAVQQLGLPPADVDFVFDKVDQHFFHPLKVETAPFILAVGREQRDYATLLKAVVGTGLQVVIVASSPWSTFSLNIGYHKNVKVLSKIPFVELRKLYAQSRLVIVPLHPVDYAAGVNTLLEAMAMGKSVILSQTKGNREYLFDNQTARGVPPENPSALRESILQLWDNPREQARLGENARQAVQEKINLDTYVDRVVDIVLQTISSNTPGEAKPPKAAIDE